MPKKSLHELFMMGEVLKGEILDAALSFLRDHGSPLVSPTNDGVLVCKAGRWAHATTLGEALAKLDAKGRAT